MQFLAGRKLFTEKCASHIEFKNHNPVENTPISCHPKTGGSIRTRHSVLFSSRLLLLAAFRWSHSFAELRFKTFLPVCCFHNIHTFRVVSVLMKNGA